MKQLVDQKRKPTVQLMIMHGKNYVKSRNRFMILLKCKMYFYRKLALELAMDIYHNKCMRIPNMFTDLLLTEENI